MKSLISLIGSIVITCSLLGQQMTEARINLEFMNGYWLLDLSVGNPLAIMGLDTRYPNKGVKFLEMNAYRELYREYLTNSLVFMIDSHPVELKNVRVVMNSAKADGQFISPRFETSGNVIYIECNAYGDLPDHRTFLTVKNGTWMQRDTLNSSNDFGIQFTVNQTSE